MLINLYGNIINPDAIVRVKISTAGDGYEIYMNNVIDATAQNTNILEIQASTVQEVDELKSHVVSELYMMNMINRLSK
jgi:hypothetical protein